MPACVAVDAELIALLSHGAACVRVAKAGKVPVGKAWHDSATTCMDTIAGWMARGFNVGILLGHGSIIDIEHDDEAGREAVERLGLASVATPTYTSDRGEHRLFRLRDPLPDCGWRKVGGIEVRIGGRPAQSVLPPSLHPFGTTYRWKIPPSECEPASITLADLTIGGAAWR